MGWLDYSSSIPGYLLAAWLDASVVQGSFDRMVMACVRWFDPTWYVRWNQPLWGFLYEALPCLAWTIPLTNSQSYKAD